LQRADFGISGTICIIMNKNDNSYRCIIKFLWSVVLYYFYFLGFDYNIHSNWIVSLFFCSVFCQNQNNVDLSSWHGDLKVGCFLLGTYRGDRLWMYCGNESCDDGPIIKRIMFPLNCTCSWKSLSWWCHVAMLIFVILSGIFHTNTMGRRTTNNSR
jgi:hypothetical protein